MGNTSVMAKQDEFHATKKRIESLRSKNRYKIVEQLDQYLSLNLDTTDNTHHYRHLLNAYKIKDFKPERNLQKLDQNTVKNILTEIEKSSYASKTQEYSKGSKNKYRKTLDYLLKMQDKYWEEMTPRGLNIYQKTDDREKTDKDELLNPAQLNDFLKAIDATSKDKYVLRNESFFYTLWNTGARVGGVRNIKVEDVTVRDQVVEVTVPAWKDSPRRQDLPLYFAAPVLKRYLNTLPENQEHLFHNREGNPIKYRGIKNIADQVWTKLENQKDDFNVKYQGQPLHIFRKSFKTYAAIMELLGPDESDIWTGHALGSTQIKQIYDRRDTSSAGSQMREALGLQTNDNTDWKQKIAPQTCTNCGQQNSSHRPSCFSCGGVLKPEQLPGQLEKRETIDIEKEIENLDLSKEQLRSLVELGEKL